LRVRAKRLLLDPAKGQPALAPRSSNRHLYTDASPLDGVPFEAKVRLLETIDAAARARDPAWFRSRPRFRQAGP
jgi:hypothetical protein